MYPEDVHDPIGYLDYLVLLLVVFLEARDEEGMQNFSITVIKIKNELSPVLALKRTLRAGDTYRAEPVKSEKIEQNINVNLKNNNRFNNNNILKFY